MSGHKPWPVNLYDIGLRDPQEQLELELEFQFGAFISACYIDSKSSRA